MQRIDILKKIEDQQINVNTIHFNSGIFPAYRSNKLLGISHPDDNIFFSAATLFILKSLIEKLHAEEIAIINRLENNLKFNYQNYQNHPERNTYNFWQKKKNKHFPNGFIFNKLNKFTLPDDIDTTSMIQIIENIPYKEAYKTKNVLPIHANKINRTIKNGHKQLRHLGAYSTWFGKNMPIEFDICVLSNLLIWLNKHPFKQNKWDKATKELIKESINHSLYFKSAFKSSPEYPKIEIILYHLSRALYYTPYLNSSKPKLTEDLYICYNRCKNIYDKIIIETSLLRLGEKIKPTLVSELPFETRNYWWFTAGLLSVYSNPIFQLIAKHPLFHFRFTCQAFNMALLFEHQVISNS